MAPGREGNATSTGATRASFVQLVRKVRHTCPSKVLREVVEHECIHGPAGEERNLNPSLAKQSAASHSLWFRFFVRGALTNVSSPLASVGPLPLIDIERGVK